MERCLFFLLLLWFCSHANWYRYKETNKHKQIHILFLWKWNAIFSNEIILWNNLDNNWPVTCRFIARIYRFFSMPLLLLWLTRYCGLVFNQPKGAICTAGILLGRHRHRQMCRLQFTLFFLILIFCTHTHTQCAFLIENSALTAKYMCSQFENSFVNGYLNMCVVVEV